MSKELKNRIEDLEAKHRFISNNLIDAVWILDANSLKYEYITPSIEKISGFTPEEFINLTIKHRLTPESYNKVREVLAKEKRRFKQGVKTVRTLELEAIHKDGAIYHIEIRAKLYKEPGNPLKIVGVTRDITERKKVEQKQNELIKQLGEALAEKEKLLKEIKVLRGLLPICSGCRRIRDERGRWWPLEAYVKSRTDADLTHTICEDCKNVFYDDLKT